jgi:hypothetical protein
MGIEKPSSSLFSQKRGSVPMNPVKNVKIVVEEIDQRNSSSRAENPEIVKKTL